MKVPILAILAVILASLACQQVATPITTATPTSQPAPLHLSPTSTATAQPRPTEAQVVIVRQPVVRVRDAADGTPTGDYIVEGQEVTVLQIDGDWVQIAKPEGWVWIGCLEGLSEKGCIAE